MSIVRIAPRSADSTRRATSSTTAVSRSAISSSTPSGVWYDRRTSVRDKEPRMPPLIPRDVLFGNPERVQPDISPDGKRLAYLAPLDGVLNVWVGTLGGSDFSPVTRDTDRGIQTFGWAHDNRH